jgi:hypothetical protein
VIALLWVLGHVLAEDGAEEASDLLPSATTAPVELGAYDPLSRTPPEIIDRARAARGLPWGQRVEAISAPWLGARYQLGPLGEGGGVDEEPVTRYDAFDCLTFVEEVLALALSPMPERAHEVRMALRYRDEEISYDNRRHFMLSEWIPGTVEQGWMEDITAQLTGAEWHDKTVTLQTWLGWKRRGLFPLTDERLPVGELRFAVLPIEQAEAALHEIPEGSLVFTVRALWDHLPIAISHVGITVPGETPTLRHASRMGKRVVRDDDLAWYVRHVQTYSNWPTEGLIVLAPQEFGPTPGHLASLQAAQAKSATAAEPSSGD